MKQNRTQELKEKQDKLDPYSDFRNFLYVIWKHLNLPDPTPVQYDIAHYLQHGPKKCQISAFRGVGKSYITVAFVAWCLYRDPQLKIMIVSASKERADAFSIFLKSLISDVPMLQFLKAKRDQRDSNIAFDVGPATPSGSPSVKSVGITGQLTGSRADIIVPDDIEIPSNSATHDQREKLSNLVKEFSAVLKPSGRIIYLGTPQTELSLYNSLESRGYPMRIWCAQYPNPQQISSYGSRLAPFILDRLENHEAGDPVDPMRFSHEDLMERKLDYGASGYALQFMLDTSLSDGNKFPLRIDDLVIMDVKPDVGPTHIYWSNNPLLKMKDLPNVAMAGQNFYSPELVDGVQYGKFSNRIMTIDPSGRGKDETGYAVGKFLNGNIFVPEVGGLNGGYSDEVLQALCHIAKRNKVNKIVVESNFGDGMFVKLLTPHLTKIYRCSVEEVRHNTQKERRIIDCLEPIMNQHRLILDSSVVRDDYETAKRNHTADEAPAYMLMYQLSRISKERGALKKDDRLDALAMLVAAFTEAMDYDQDQAEKKRQELAFDEEIERMRRELGRGSSVSSVKMVGRLDKPLKSMRGIK